MANTDDITAQINKIYKADVTSIRNLAEISKKLQEGKLSIPGNLTVEGKLFAQGDSDMKLLKASSIILAGRNILNELNQLNSTIRSLSSRLTNSDNRHANTERKLSNLPSRLSNLESKFPASNQIKIGDGIILKNAQGFHCVSSRKYTSLRAYAFGTVQNGIPIL